jgi:hypothetical protein
LFTTRIGPAGLAGIAGDPHILFSDAFFGIDNDKGDIGRSRLRSASTALCSPPSD